LPSVRIECEHYPEATAKDGRAARPAGFHPRIRRAVSTKGVVMSPAKFAIVVATILFASGAIGFVLQRLLPEKYTTDASRNMVQAVVGLLTLLSALVLGLLIWTAYGVYSDRTLQSKRSRPKTCNSISR
jgi:hypothetical protein